MKAKCPNNPDHKQFVTVAHVSENWVVDPDGNFLEMSHPGELVAAPDRGNTWSCADCGADAVDDEEVPCEHDPVWASAVAADSCDGIIDISCRICGASGSTAIQEGDINW